MAKKKSQGLGKGLGALIRPLDQQTGQPIEVMEGSGLRMVALKEIRPNPHQPRTEFDEEALEELADSIREHGLIQPLIVNQVSKNDYHLIAGERRWRASQKAGLTSVPAVVKNDVTALEMLELAIIENVQREDLNALEEGLAYKQLIDEFGFTQAQVAKRMGKGRPTIANMIRLLDLPERVQEAVINDEISTGHARALLRLDSTDERTAVMHDIIKFGLNVRQVEEIVRKRAEKTKPKKKPRALLSPELEDVERQFGERFATRVNIEKTRQGGKVIIHYYSDEQLNYIFDIVTQPKD